MNPPIRRSFSRDAHSCQGLRLVAALLQLLPEFVEDGAPVWAVQLALKLLKRGRDHMVVMGAGKSRIRGYFKPDLVQQIEILVAQPRSVRAEVILALDTIRHTHFHHQARLGIRQPFPCVAGELGLFVRTQLVGQAADDAA